MDYNEFAEQIKTKYPQYKDTDNKELSEKIIAKYPQYKEQVSFDVQTQIQPTQTQIQEVVEKKPDNTNDNVITGGVSQNYTQNWDKKGRVYLTDENGNRVKPNNLNPVEKLGRKFKGFVANRANWINETNPESKTYQDKANALLAVETLPIGAGKTLTQLGTKALTPYLGKKLAQGTAQGIGSGLVGGSAYGFGSGVIEGENPLKTATQSAVLGALLGGGIGLGGGKIGQKIAGNKLKEIKEVKPLRKAEKEYYKNYIQQTNTKRKDLGKIDYTNAGLETTSKDVQAGRNFDSLKNDIKNAEYVAEELPTHTRKDNIVKFHRLRKDNQDFLVGETADGKKYYMSQINDGSTGLPSRAGVEPSTNSITDNAKSVNPLADKKTKMPAIDREKIQYHNEYTAQEAEKQIKNEIGELKNSENKKTYITLSKKNRFWKKNIDTPYERATLDADTEFNSIIGEIQKDPQVLKNPAKTQEFETRLSKKLDNLEPEHAQEYWEKYYQTFNKLDELDKVNSNLEYANLLRDKGEIKESRLPKGADLPAGVEQAVKDVPPEYEVLHNKDLIAQAENAISDNPNTLGDLKLKANDKDEKLSALDFEKGRQLISKLYAEKRYSEAIDLTESLSKKASEAGQAVQALSLWKRTTPEGAISFAQKLIDKYNKSTGNKLKLTPEQAEYIEKLSELVQKASEGREQEVAIGNLMKAIADVTPKSWNKKYDTFRYMNMLLSPKSRIKDFVLTGLNSVDNAIDETIANGIDAIRTGLGIKGREKVFSGLHPKEWFSGLKKGYKEGAEDVRLGINTSRSGESGRYGLPKTPSFEKKPVLGQRWESLRDNPISNALNNILAGGERALNYTIQVPDRMFYEARFASSLADQMKAKGVTVPTTEMINQASKEASEAVYQDKSIVSTASGGLRNLINGGTEAVENTLGLKPNTIPRAGDFVMPFVVTPANIVNQGLKNTFGGIPGAIKLATAKNAGQIRDAEILLAKQIKGLAPLAIGASIGSGNIKSNIGSNDYQSDSITGLKPQSIVVGDKAISLKDYPQWSIPMSIASGATQGGLGQALANAGQAVADISALKTLGDIASSFKSGYGNDLSAGEIADNLIRNVGTNIVTQNIPFGGALGELRNDVDPYSRELYTPDTLKYVANRIENRLPFVSKTLPQKYNAIGEPVYTNNINNPIGRALSEAFDFGVRNYNENPVYNTYENFKNDIKESDITGKGQVGFKKAPRTIKVNGEKVKLDNKQYSQYQKEYGRLLYDTRNNLLQDTDLLNSSTEQQVKVLNDWRQGVNQAVLYKLFGAVPNKWNKHAEDIYNYYYGN